jgi:hypothetical protein
MSPFEALTIGFVVGLAFACFHRLAVSRFGFISRLSVSVASDDGCASVIVRELYRASTEILVPSRLFSCPAIAAELIAAIQRGVAVHLLLADSVETVCCPSGDSPASRNLRSLIETHAALGNGKVVLLVDRGIVISGRLQFDHARPSKGDSLLVIKGCPDLARAWACHFLADRDEPTRKLDSEDNRQAA